MTKRKKINVIAVLTEANKQLAKQDDEATEDFKKGVCIMIERILMDTGNYNGYNYNIWNNGGCEAWQKDGKPDFPEKEKYMYSNHGGCYDRYYYFPVQ